MVGRRRKFLVSDGLKKAKIMLEAKAFGETFLSVFSNFVHFYIKRKLADEILSVFQDSQKLL